VTRAVSVSDWREAARRRLPRVIFDYIDGGAYGEVSLLRNLEAFEAIQLRQRVMVDVSRLKLTKVLFGQPFAMPLMLAPVGMAGMYARRGEVQAARAAEKAGIPFILSTVSICDIEETRAAVTAPPWFQLYMLKDRGYMVALLERARAAGAPGLIFTVDLPVPGARYRDARNGLVRGGGLADRMARAVATLRHPAWLWDVGLRGRPHTFGNVLGAVSGARGIADFWTWVAANFDPSVTWADIDWVRRHWDGPILLKGVMDAQDARRALDTGVEGIVVSNHGGRQLDGVPASIQALPAIVEAVDGRASVLMDGGVRSGLDVLKALALGADAVMLGRAWAFALGGGGGEGVSAMLGVMRRELMVAMALTGCVDVEAAGPSLLVAGEP